MKWKGFAEPTWETRDNLDDIEALDLFEKKYGKEDGVGEEAGSFIGRRKVTKQALQARATNDQVM